MQKFDVIIIGAGMAGLTAAIYCARANKSAAIIEKNVPGGQILTTPDVQNYPGFESVSGYELTDKVRAQAEALGAQLIYDNITAFDLTKKEKTVTGLSDTYSANAVILAMGSQSKTLGLKNEAELTGSGVSYCATCDGAFFKNKAVLVAGSGKTAVNDVNYLAPIASKVYILDNKRLPDFEQKNVEKLPDSVITELIGAPLEKVRIKTPDGEKVLDINGLFVAAGYSPSTFLVKDAVELNEKGYIVTDENMRTNVSGVFAAGDIREKSLRQLVTAAGDGAVAAQSAVKFLAQKN